jgi:ribulose-phosphate 3-epimerase
MATITPAILPRSYEDLVDGLSRLKHVSRDVQIDICDGKFVENTTWPFKRFDQFFEAITHEESAMPFWEDFDFEFDLMIAHPEKEFENFILAGAKRLIFHLETLENPAAFLVKLRTQFVKGADIPFEPEIGMALSLDTPLEKILPLAPDLDCIQCMGIAKIGFQGQEFDRRVLEQVRALRAALPEMKITVDGGVSEAVARELVEAGATTLVVGSKIMHAVNPLDAYKKLSSLVVY